MLQYFCHQAKTLFGQLSLSLHEHHSGKLLKKAALTGPGGAYCCCCCCRLPRNGKIAHTAAVCSAAATAAIIVVGAFVSQQQQASYCVLLEKTTRPQQQQQPQNSLGCSPQLLRSNKRAGGKAAVRAGSRLWLAPRKRRRNLQVCDNPLYPHTLSHRGRRSARRAGKNWWQAEDRHEVSAWQA